MSVVRVGATKQYSDNWDNIFTGKRSSSGKKTATKPARKSSKRTVKVAKKSAGKKRAGGAKRRAK